MSEFPALPVLSDDQAWSNSILDTYDILLDAFNRAQRFLNLEDVEPIRLRVLAGTIRTQMLEFIHALKVELRAHAEWVATCSEVLQSSADRLEEAADGIEGRAPEQIDNVEPILVIRSGHCGRPMKDIDRSWLADAASAHRKITNTSLARALGIHRNTLRNNLKRHGIQKQFSEISDLEIDALIQQFKQMRPNSGLRYAVGFFKQLGIRVQKERIRHGLLRIDAIGQAMRKHATIDRRNYHVSRPHALWHMDGHHKLIRWGIVIHGFVDGYTHLVVSMKASNNNRSDTVFEVFLNAVSKYSIPSRVRGDRGGENIDVSVWMIKYRGPNRGSYIWGPSTRNTRIERMWVETGSQVGRYWRLFFKRLEKLHYLDPDNSCHLWLIHLLFLDMINSDLADFQSQWNHHPISGKGHDQTPEDMCFLGELEHGKYKERTLPIHPETIQKYSTEDDLDEVIANDQQHNIRHAPTEVPAEHAPFNSEAQTLFLAALREAIEVEIIPENLGLQEHEWEGGLYPESEQIKVGKKTYNMFLPFNIWYPRAVMWGIALHLMIEFQIILD